MKAINYACFKLEEKATKSIQKDKNNFINVIKDKFVMSYVISFCKKIFNCIKYLQLLNPFQANVPFLYPLKTLENLRLSDVFRGYRKGALAWNGLSNEIRNCILDDSYPISWHWYLPMSPENIRKPLVFWCISGSTERDQCHEMV